jgi:hypothetical protein
MWWTGGRGSTHGLDAADDAADWVTVGRCAEWQAWRASGATPRRCWYDAAGDGWPLLVCVRACVWCVPTRGVGASPTCVRRHEPVARVCGGRESRRAVQVPLCVRRAFPSGRDRMYVARPVRYRPGDASTAAAAASQRCTFVGHSTWTPFPTTFFPLEAGSAGGVRDSPSTSAAAARPPPMHQAGLLGFTRDSETVGAATEETPSAEATTRWHDLDRDLPPWRRAGFRAVRAATAAASRYATFATFPALPRAEDRAPAAVRDESLDHIDLGDGIYYPNHLSLLGSASSLAIARVFACPALLPSTSLYLHRLRSKITLKKKCLIEIQKARHGVELRAPSSALLGVRCRRRVGEGDGSVGG